MNEKNEILKNMTDEEIKNYELIESLSTPTEDVIRGLHETLFPETYDMMGDSIHDAKMRRHGKNPMSSEYTKEVNARRRRLGFAPLGSNGLPTDYAQTLQYCEDLIRGKKKYRPNCT